MNSILRISDAASIAIHTMYILSKDKDKLFTTKDIANTLMVSENHLAKIMQRLAKADLVDSIRGPKGGFKLKKSGDTISLLDIYEIIDGSLPVNACLLNKPVCGNNCVLGDFLSDLNNRVREYLKYKKLSELGNPGCI